MESPKFASTLRKLRTGAGMTLRDLEASIGVTASTISRWELGQTTPRRDDVVRVDEFLRASGRLIKLWTAQTTGSSLPPWMQDVAAIMDEAIAIECISPSLVPGLLQCPEYAEMVLMRGQPLLPVDEVRTLAQTRGRRYEELRTGKDPVVSVVMPERAVSLMPDPVRRAQAAYLCDVVDAGRVHVCLVPDDVLMVGVASPLVLARLPGDVKIGASDHQVGNKILDENTDWGRIDEIERHTYTLASSASQSRAHLGAYR